MPEELKNYTIGFTVFTFYILGMISIMAIFMTSNPNFISGDDFENFNSTFNKFYNLNESVGGLQANIEDDENKDPGQWGVLNSLISGAWQALSVTLTTLDFIPAVLVGLTSWIGIPWWITSLIIMMITIIVVYAIYGAIFQR